MRLLGQLGLFQRHFGVGEIGAGILHVLVEEEPVEVARKVVVTLDVAFRPRRSVDLLEAAQGHSQAFDGA